LTVHMGDPFVPEGDIVSFLQQFVDLQGVGKRDLEPDGVWTGKRTYQMRLRLGKTVAEGVIHPPAFFKIGTRKGYLEYSGQPLACYKCGERGHFARLCTLVRCRLCETLGHMAKECVQGKRCFLCKEIGHVSRECTK
ncbi:ZCHC3 protein, partial [Atractosteus spatula]|nr:ZCHC3 protein [Atractosteus spatula]